MKTEKEKQLQYEFGKKYSEYSKNRGWEDRIFIKVLMKDVSTILFESTMHDSNIPIDTTDLENIEKLWPVFEGKPNSGKSTMLIDVVTPAITSILIENMIFPIWILVNPTSDILKDQTSQLAEGMTNSEPIALISFNGKTGIKEKINSISRSKNYFSNTTGILFMLNQAMINAGIGKGCKPYTKKLFNTVVDKIKKEKPEFKIAVFGLHDECRISSYSLEVNSQYAGKNPYKSPISFMPALYEFYNSVIPKINHFQVVGFDGTPKYNQKQEVPLRKVAALPLPGVKQQTDDWSVTIPYGGEKDIWEVKELSEYVPKSADTLDESYYSGMTTINLQNWNIIIDESLKYVNDLNEYNLNQSKTYNEKLHKYNVQIDTLERMIISIGGADDDTKPNAKYVKGEQECANYLQKKNAKHVLFTDKAYYYMDENGKKYDNLTLEEVAEYIDGYRGNGVSFAILKRKRQMGWNCPSICGYVGLSEHTDLMPNHETAKPYDPNAQSATRGVRQYTALVNLDGAPLTLREAAKLIGQLKRDKQNELAEKIFKLVKKNNQFKVWYVSGLSKVHEQLDNYLKTKYSDSDLFLKMFKEEINKYDDHDFSECICGNCPVHGGGSFKNQKIDEEKADKDMPEISEKLNKKLKIAA